MNADFFFKFAKFKFGSVVNAEDFSDRVNYQWTGALLVMFTTIIALRQYIFTPIQCWVPPEWPRPWEEYTENYCWIQSTYHVSFNDPGFPEPKRREELELNYYQWVPFVLALQALLVYTPHLIWKLLALYSGYNPNAMVKFAMEAATIDQDKKKKLIGFLARQMEKAMKSRKEWRDPNSCYMGFRDCCKTVLPCFWFGKRSGTMLFSLYITNKLVYIGVGITHIFFMQYFLGMKSIFFGAEILWDLIHRKSWETTHVFPRVTFCDVPHKTVGQWNIRSVQCVLPVNMLNEKIYILLWFWVIGGMCLTVVTAIAWIIRLFFLKNRQNFITKYLKILNVLVDDQQNSEIVKKFVSDFLRHDGLFILMMIANNVGDVCVADIIEQMYNKYAEVKPEQPEGQPLLANHKGGHEKKGKKKKPHHTHPDDIGIAMSPSAPLDVPKDFLGTKSMV